ncbi:membrane protein S22 [Saimiriine betaherpesvirus 4]|uniref:Membrane protein S22 n=1 Tax=Saimiriine betaherpesvirus 4 TaxID=1535247 RepID=G8XT48_9BETA|nr:membrane protein S22 [Saimiriine betaherpesvirus 4]AEV80997.1 membrane protein S22 [Saimiriine betaherpesvirus 4]
MIKHSSLDMKNKTSIKHQKFTGADHTLLEKRRQRLSFIYLLCAIQFGISFLTGALIRTTSILYRYLQTENWIVYIGAVWAWCVHSWIVHSNHQISWSSSSTWLYFSLGIDAGFLTIRFVPYYDLGDVIWSYVATTIMFLLSWYTATSKSDLKLFGYVSRTQPWIMALLYAMEVVWGSQVMFIIATLLIFYLFCNMTYELYFQWSTVLPPDSPVRHAATLYFQLFLTQHCFLLSLNYL